MRSRLDFERLLVGAVGAAMLIGLLEPSRLSAQSSTSDWEKAAGGKIAFEVASIKQNLEPYPPGGSPPHSSFPLDSGDSYSLNGGLFNTTKWPLYVYIGFAYRLTPYANSRVIDQLPKWAKSDHFDIEARAADGMKPTKDQLRLMVRSLLADRFKLVVHMETKEVPLYALVLARAGTTGPQLKPYSGDPPCGAAEALDAPPLQNVGGVTVRLWSDRDILEAGKILATVKPGRKAQR